jgi:hypothetical protein
MQQSKVTAQDSPYAHLLLQNGKNNLSETPPYKAFQQKKKTTVIVSLLSS